MVTTLGIRENIKSFNDLQAKFDLTQAEDERFFLEWEEDLPEITDADKQALDRLRERYVYHRSASPLLEGTVNLIVVSPLLEIAGFLDPPFRIYAPESVAIEIEDPEEIVTGLIDVLVVCDRLWVLVVEAKRTGIPIPSALPQILAYMMANPTSDRPTFGMVTNGDESLFVKLSREGTPKFEVSNSFLLLPRRNSLYQLLRVLKRLGQMSMAV